MCDVSAGSREDGVYLNRGDREAAAVKEVGLPLNGSWESMREEPGPRRREPPGQQGGDR